MVDPHGQMSDQRTLDIPNHLLRRQLRGGQHVNLIDGSAISRDYPRRDHTRQSQDQLLRTLDREDASSDRGRQDQGRCVSYEVRLASERAASMGVNTKFRNDYYGTGML